MALTHDEWLLLRHYLNQEKYSSYGRGRLPRFLPDWPNNTCALSISNGMSPLMEYLLSPSHRKMSY